MRIPVLLLLLIFATGFAGYGQWKADQLIEPSALNELLKKPKHQQPNVLNIGPVGNIRGAIQAGTVSTEDGFEKFKTISGYYPKNELIIIYCGCCTLGNCPNISKAYEHLTASGFKNVRVLNLPTGLTEDWIQKGFPIE